MTAGDGLVESARAVRSAEPVPLTPGRLPSPMDAYQALDGVPGRILLESRGPVGPNSRWSFLCLDPVYRLVAEPGGLGTLVDRDGEVVATASDPFELLSPVVPEEAIGQDLPPFRGGWAGYLGYELATWLERVPRVGFPEVPVPDLHLGWYDTILAWDRETGREWMMAGEGEEAIRSAFPPGRSAGAPGPPGTVGNGSRPRARRRGGAGSDLSAWARSPRGEYEAAIGRVRRHIAEGDVFQVNLSQRFARPLPGSAWSFHRELAEANPAPFSAFIDLGDVAISSASPELFLSVRDGVVETRPIKGTRPRDMDPERDRALAAELEASAKDRAENTMIVDLLRNDLSRVCEDDSVVVPSLCALESHPTVHHLVSTVRGRLRSGVGPADVLRATFPCGSVTGAPKLRAIEIAAELECTERGVYTGAIGWIGADGAMGLSVAIRTAMIRDRRVHVGAGGGIVYESDPAAEYMETVDKARALLEAAE